MLARGEFEAATERGDERRRTRDGTSAMDIQYDEDVGNPARPDCLISINKDEELYEMTEKIFPWELPADGDVTRRVTPILFLEGMTRRAPADLRSGAFFRPSAHRPPAHHRERTDHSTHGSR